LAEVDLYISHAKLVPMSDESNLCSAGYFSGKNGTVRVHIIT